MMNRRDFLKIGATGATAVSLPVALFNTTIPSSSDALSTEDMLEARELIKHDYVLHRGQWCCFEKHTDYRVDIPAWQHFISFDYRGAPMIWAEISDSKEFLEIPFKTRRI